jgi:hypothetical protein
MTSTYSICIPHVYKNISAAKIYSIFNDKYRLGRVSSVDIKRRNSNDKNLYNMVFVQFSEWNDENISAINLKKMIENPYEEARLVYDDPWYWVLLPNNNTSKQAVNHNIIHNSRHYNSHKSYKGDTRPMKTKTTMSLRDCYSRITMLENELSRLYNRLYRRVYPEPMLSSDSEITPINPGPMTVDELHTIVSINTSGELHQHPNHVSDESSLTTDYDDDYDEDYDHDYDDDSTCDNV